MGLDLSKLDIPADTLRRLRYGTFESTDALGRTSFKHDPGIREGRISSVSVDRGHGHISETILRAEQAADATAPSEPEPTAQPRDEAGRFASKSEQS
jgi:hypothetical protein